MEFVRLLTRIARGLRRSRPAASPHLAPRHVGVLVEVMAAPGAVAVSSLANRLQVNLATASLLVGELAEAGLLTRAEDPADHRRTLVGLAGPQAAALVADWLAPLERALGQLPGEQREAAVRALQGLVRRLDANGGDR